MLSHMNVAIIKIFSNKKQHKHGQTTQKGLKFKLLYKQIPFLDNRTFYLTHKPLLTALV